MSRKNRTLRDRRIGGVVVGLAVFLLVLGPPAAHALRLSPAMQVGESYALDLSLEETVATSVELEGESMPLREGKARIALRGTFEVLAVDRWKRPTGRRVVIDRFVVGATENESEILPAGTAVLISQSTQTSAAIAADGTPLPPQVASALETLFDAWSAVGVDEMFATDMPALEGTHWPVVPDKALRALGLEDDSIVNPAAIKGEVRIVGEGSFAGTPCTMSELTLEFPMRDPDGDMPADAKMDIALERSDCSPLAGAAAPRTQDERYITMLSLPVEGGGVQVTRQERRLRRKLTIPKRSLAAPEYL
ncbi:MAG: hypothetical protein ACI8TX_003354 [Hyphomicrobiaceae bacterium]|jgi:hypothetical protein